MDGRPTIDANGKFSYGQFSSSFAVWANGKASIGLRSYPAGAVAMLPPTNSILEVKGSINTIGSTYTTTSSFADNTAIYFGTPNVLGSWRIILSGSGATSTLNVERYNGTQYTQDTVFTP